MNEQALARLTHDRRQLHMMPELDHDLPQTLAYIERALSRLKCQVFSPYQSALCAYFDFGRAGTAAFRSDMDALPVSENTGLPFCSIHEGCMHACGHDGHMAILLELARETDALASPPPFNVLLIFQPAEETTGGAKYICQSGIFEKYNVRHIFGLHLWPSLPGGQAATRPGPMLARSSEVTVNIEGKSSHIARSWEGRDALLAGVLFIQRAYQMVETEVEKGPEPRLLKFGRMDSGTARGVISSHTSILGSLRSFDQSVFIFMKSRLFELALDIENETGCRIDININEGYPPVVNDAELYSAISDFLKGDMPALLPEPFMIAEDFSYYGQKAPSLFFLLGTGSDEPLHSDRFNFDESILLSGVELYKRLLFFPGI